MAKNSNDNYKYDAFISYRHCEPDKFVAETLHKQLEAFRLPGNVIKKIKKDNPDAKTRITRVFRDEEELPLANNLADPIIDAINNSEWLIVICSPRLKESMWCRKEIDTFISIHGRENVLAVLVEGEPSDSFPEQLTYREVEVTNFNGVKEIKKEAIEPLAADARGNSNAERVRKIKGDIARIVAPMFNLGYDDLKQRHRERKMKRVIGLVSVIAVISFIFAVLSTFSALTIRKQKEDIQAKSNELAEQSIQISNQNAELVEMQAESLAADALECLSNDDTTGAIKIAYESLTEHDGIAMPYTDAGMYALNASLRPYEATDGALPLYSFETAGVVEMIISSPSQIYAVIYDSSETITFWSYEKKKVAGTVHTNGTGMREELIQFIDDDTILFSNGNDICKYNVISDELETLDIDDTVWNITSLKYDPVNDILYYAHNGGVSGIRCSDSKEVFNYEIDSKDESVRGRLRVRPNDFIIIPVNNSENLFIKVVSTETGEVLFDQMFPDEIYRDAYFNNGKLYILSEYFRKSGDKKFGSIESALRCFSFEDGRQLWSRYDDTIKGDKLFEITTDGRATIVEVGKKGIMEVDELTGEMLVIDNNQNDILWSGKTESAVVYLTSTPIKMFLMTHTTMGFNASIQSNLRKIAYGAPCQDGFFLAEDRSNRVVFYGVADTSAVEEYHDVEEVKDVTEYSYTTALDEISEMGIEDININMIYSVVFDEDEEYICVNAKDGTARLYKYDNREYLCTINLINSYDYIKEFLGTDEDGNIYFAGNEYGYCLSPNYNLIAAIKYLRGIDDDLGVYILGIKSSEERYCVPRYSLEELLEKAEDYLEY